MANRITDYIETTLGVKFVWALHIPTLLEDHYKHMKFPLNHAKKYPYFSIEEYGKEAEKHFDDGNLILKNIFTPNRLLIKKELFEVLHERDFMKVIEDWKIEEEVFDQMMSVSDEIEKLGKLAPGFMFSFGVADGSAHYVVTKVNKKTIKYEHRSFFDGYICQAMGIDGSMDIDKFKSITMFGKPSIFASVRHG